MQTLTEKAYAKVNLTLDVLARREDGYHDIRSIMQTISLCDDVEIRVGTKAPWKVACRAEDGKDYPQDEKNLAWKAAEVFFAKTGIDPDGVAISIVKRIPSEAGLAGGSADAAAVLRGLSRLYPRAVFASELCSLGASVGADVPFCVLCGTVLCEGTGEVLTPLLPAPEMYFAVCKPEFSVSTATLYGKIDEAVIEKRPDHKAMQRSLIHKQLAKIGANLANVFEPLVAKEHPEIAQICQTMRACGAYGAQMTGSGSAVFGIFETEQQAQAACAKLKEHFESVFCAKTV